MAVRCEVYNNVVLKCSTLSFLISASKLWSILGNTTEIDKETWPTVDKDALKEDEITVVVQVNGKVRARMSIDPSLDENTVTEKALATEEVKKFYRR